MDTTNHRPRRLVRGDALRRRREAQLISAAAVATALGISRQRVGQMEASPGVRIDRAWAYLDALLGLLGEAAP